MRKKITSKPTYAGEGHFAIVAARYNARYVDALLKAARSTLKEAGAGRVRVWRVPGSFEIPVVAAHLASMRRPRYGAVICLGVIFQGETRHADHIAQSVSQALADLQISAGTPIIHGVGLYDSQDQAKARCLDPTQNRGREAALTALEMDELMGRLRGD